MIPYLLLGLAIAAEVGATSLMPRTQGFTAPWTSVAVLAGYGLSIVLLAQVVRVIPVGIAYATWSAVGTLAVAVIGVLFLRQSLTVYQAGGIVLVAVGVAFINLGGQVHH